MPRRVEAHRKRFTRMHQGPNPDVLALSPLSRKGQFFMGHIHLDMDLVVNLVTLLTTIAMVCH